MYVKSKGLEYKAQFSKATLKDYRHISAKLTGEPCCFACGKSPKERPGRKVRVVRKLIDRGETLAGLICSNCTRNESRAFEKMVSYLDDKPLKPMSSIGFIMLGDGELT
jgi:hypothetical protein